MRTGLKNASGTKLQINGAAYGAGIYLSPHAQTVWNVHLVLIALELWLLSHVQQSNFQVVFFLTWKSLLGQQQHTLYCHL